MPRLDAVRITPTSFLLLLAVCGALLVGAPREATADRLCKADGVRCKTNQSCCSGVCTANVCGTPTTTTTTTSTTTTTLPPCSGTCSAGPNAGMPCTTNATTGNPATSNTSQDCPPESGLFYALLSVDLNPLTTGSASMTNATGMFCPSQSHAGAFGQATAQCITQAGSPAGNLTDGMPHAATEATVFCIPATGNGTFNILFDVDGPGATSLPGVAQIVPTPSLSLKFTTTAGTTACGGAGFSTPAGAPFSGEIDSDTACTTKIADLGASCLYIGGGSANTYPPTHFPAGSTYFFDLDMMTPGNLVASNGTGNLDCTKGASTTNKHCVSANAPQPSCTTYADCPVSLTDSNACQPVENCFFGPPLAVQLPVYPSLALCLINVIATDASGTFDATTGAATVDIPLASRVYVTGNEASPCPQCNCGTPP